MPSPLAPSLPTRRQLLWQCGGGLGLIGLAHLLGREGLLAADHPQALNPLAPKQPHFAGRARAVIWIFVNGGPSQVDTWDYKPALARYDGKELPGFDRHTGFFINDVGPLMKSPFTFRRYGQCGKWASSIFPCLSQHVDRMAFFHSLYSESNNHSPTLFLIKTSLPLMAHP